MPVRHDEMDKAIISSNALNCFILNSFFTTAIFTGHAVGSVACYTQSILLVVIYEISCSNTVPIHLPGQQQAVKRILDKVALLNILDIDPQLSTHTAIELLPFRE